MTDVWVTRTFGVVDFRLRGNDRRVGLTCGQLLKLPYRGVYL
ncbi:MAG TPA: hypothetical protein VEC36_09390 [Patescibacteria group bacterium]|nr:hypothetical protein [Patescibacteria group bacterium]